GNKEVRFGGIGNGQREPAPRTLRVEGALVVPGAEEAKDHIAEGTAEEPVHLIQSPDKPRGRLLGAAVQSLSPQKALEVHVPAALRVRARLQGGIQIELVGNHRRKGLKERRGRFHL